MAVKRALVSVSNKEGLVPFVKALVELGIEVISTGGTKKTLEEAGIPVIGIEEVTGFPEILDGRVKTLHPKIHGGLLSVRDNDAHVKQLAEHHITPIDLVVVNLYPFKQTIGKPDVTFAEAIENIDIGGPSMLRAAAKNHAYVTVVVDPNDYDKVLAELKEKKRSVRGNAPQARGQSIPPYSKLRCDDCRIFDKSSRRTTSGDANGNV